MSLKHSVKLALREVYARVLWHTGLARLVDRLSPRRLLVLYGHCVDDPAVNGDLAPEMKLPEERLELLLRKLGRRHDLVTVGEGLDRLREGPGRSMVALSMDDGYVDNLTRLVPLLERVDARATVFLEAGPVLERRLGWLHAFEWLCARLGSALLAERFAARSRDPAVAARVADAAGDADRLKRAFKYDVPAADRDELLAALMAEEGGDAATLVDRLYLDAVRARALVRSGRVEVGGHTVDHPVLSRLEPEAQRAQVSGGRERLGAALDGAGGVTFAYPYGRSWDFDEASVEAARAAGYRYAVTTHAGVNRADTDPYRARRWPVQASTPLHLLGVEAAGGFEWLRRLGLDLVE